MEFEELKDKIVKFVKEELYSLEPWIYSCEWDEKLPKLNELREKVKKICLLYTSPSPRDCKTSRMPSSA